MPLPLPLLENVKCVALKDLALHRATALYDGDSFPDLGARASVIITHRGKSMSGHGLRQIMSQSKMSPYVFVVNYLLCIGLSVRNV